MSEQWQIRRGTTAENDNFTGAEGEITMDTDKKQLRVHDGQTQGGWTLPNLVQVMQAVCPDYLNITQLSNLDSYQQIQEDGYVFVQGSGSGNWRDIGLYISTNGTTSTLQITIASMYDTRFLVPVSKGVYVKRYDSYTTLLYFIPCKGNN